jgi:Sigma-70 region 2
MPGSSGLSTRQWLRSVFLIVRDRGRAEEITQEAFVKLYTHWRRVARYDRPDAWVRRVAIRMAIRSDYWFSPEFDGMHLRMDFLSLTQWRPETDPRCFITAGTVIELTNPFRLVT